MTHQEKSNSAPRFFTKIQCFSNRAVGEDDQNHPTPQRSLPSKIPPHNTQSFHLLPDSILNCSNPYWYPTLRIGRAIDNSHQLHTGKVVEIIQNTTQKAYLHGTKSRPSKFELENQMDFKLNLSPDLKKMLNHRKRRRECITDGTWMLQPQTRNSIE